MFCRNEKVVYPGYGIAIVQDIITKNIMDKKSEFFQLQFINKDMMILVPIEKIRIVGLRKLSKLIDIKKIFSLLSEPFFNKNEEKSLIATWSKRQKEYQLKIQSGNLEEIALMYRELKSIEIQKELSFGEKTLLLQTEDLIAEEISIVKNCKYIVARDNIRDLVAMQLKMSDIIHKKEIKEKLYK